LTDSHILESKSQSDSAYFYHQLLWKSLRLWEPGFRGRGNGSEVKIHRIKKRAIPLCGKNNKLLQQTVSYKELAG